MRDIRHPLSLHAAWLLVLLLSAAGRGDEPAVYGVRAVAFSPDGKLLAAATGEPDEPGTVTLWDLATLKPRWAHTEKTGIPGVVFAPDGQTLAIAIYDHTAKLLDTAGGKVQVTLRHPKEVRAVAFSPDGKLLATACWDGLLRVWDTALGVEKVTSKGNRDRIFGVQFSPDGKLLLSAGGNDGARLWDAATGEEKRTWSQDGLYIRCARFSNDGRWVLAGGWDGTVRLWDVESGVLRARFGRLGGVDGVAFSPEERVLAVCTGARNVQLFELSLGEPTAKDQERIRALLARLDDESYDVREATGKELLQIGFLAEPELRRAMAESPSAEVRLRARRLRQELLSKPRTQLRGHTAEIECVSFAPDGKRLASGDKEGTVRLWDVVTGKELAKLAYGKER
jgi:WD40 repeat protein